MKEADRDKLLARYLLGQLPEPDQVSLEAEYLADSGAQERLKDLEDDLIDGYLRGELSAGERKGLEAGLLASPRGRRKLEVAKAMMALASEARSRRGDPASEARKMAPPLRFFRAFSVRFIFATAALIAVLALTWTVVERVRRRPGPQLAHPGQAEPANQPPPKQPINAANPPAPEEGPAGHLHPPSVMAAITLEPGLSRTAGAPPQVVIPRGARRLGIQLVLPADNYPSYRVALMGEGDNEKWTSRGLKSRPADGGSAVVVSLSASLFKDGEYTLVLSPDGNPATPVAEYTFIIQKK